MKKRGFTYDASGNLINDVDLANSANNREIRYAAFEKPVYIKKGSSNANEISFRYGTGRERYRRIDNVYENGQPITVETTYLGSYEKVVHTGGAKNGDVEHKYYIAGVALRIDTDKANGSSESKTSYMHKDHLGSVIAISDESGNAVKRFRYDPFGKQYEVTNVSPLTEMAVVSKLAITDKGFTGHEMLNSVDIIHMNGRIYDANIGRFLQADAYIQAPKNMQNMDRYSYVLNNPLSYTDPSGHFFKSLKKYWRVIAAVVINYVFCSGGCTFLETMAAGAVSGAVATGNLRGAISGAFSAGVFYGIGTYYDSVANANGAAVYKDLTETYGLSESFSSGVANSATQLTTAQQAGKVLAHAMAGGVMSKLNGAKFGNGFISAGITQSFSKSINGLNTRGSRIFAASLLGGSVSKLTGGKFASGALTAAFSRTFNDESHMEEGSDSDIGAYSPASGIYATEDGKAVNIQVTDNGLVNGDGSVAYAFDYRTGLVYPIGDTGRVSSVAPESYAVGAAGLFKGTASYIGQRLFLSETFGITSSSFAHSVTGVTGTMNVTGSSLKVGWSSVSANGGGMMLRVGVGGSGNMARFHMYVPGSFVPNKFANGVIQVKRALKKMDD
ncbi:RHS repeat domain-containing protein [Aliikangiella sp. IMCC44359]|uniref:RHS repeat domain-containing protein n=1 Tax=Aliikangiella sp. IMCC44359 TaxID=3459125 RepID=UPI00403AE771